MDEIEFETGEVLIASPVLYRYTENHRKNLIF